jgi:hypothetical protein
VTSELTTQQLDEIAARAAGLYEYATGLDAAWQDEADQLSGTDVPALLAAVRRLRDRVAELEAYAHGCNGEGCVIPHSSWCEVAKKAAAANDGCTCPKPWKGHPQPHAGYCWLVSPPRNEIEEMRRALAERAALSTAEAADLVDAMLTAEPDHTRASALYEVLLKPRATLPCTCARSQGLHEKCCRRYVPGHDLLSPVRALAAYRAERAAVSSVV